MPGKADITGYAIVSDDDRIADADGLIAAALRNDKDWELYQRAQASCGPRGVRAPQPRTRAEHSRPPCAWSYRARRRGSRADRTAGGGTRGARPGKKWRRGSCRREDASPSAAARWCSISSLRSALTGFIFRARME